jgi:hypothetical protein
LPKYSTIPGNFRMTKGACSAQAARAGSWSSPLLDASTMTMRCRNNWPMTDWLKGGAISRNGAIRNWRKGKGSVESAVTSPSQMKGLVVLTTDGSMKRLLSHHTMGCVGCSAKSKAVSGLYRVAVPRTGVRSEQNSLHPKRTCNALAP